MMPMQIVSKEKPNKKRLQGDVWIFVLTVCLSAFGVLAVYSSSSYVAEKEYGDAFFFVKKIEIGRTRKKGSTEWQTLIFYNMISSGC